MKLRKIITRRRARGAGKWAGLAAIACLTAVMVASYWYWPLYIWSRANSSTTWYVNIGNWGVLVVRSSGPTLDPGKPFRSWSLSTRKAWKASVLSVPGQGSIAPQVIQWLPTYTSAGRPPYSTQVVSVPIWIPLLLIAVPTAWLWRVDRRVKPWQCAKCRYDLRGLEGVVCPECGSAVSEG